MGKDPSIGGLLCVLMGARHGHGGVCMSGGDEGHAMGHAYEEPSEV